MALRLLGNGFRTASLSIGKYKFIEKLKFAIHDITFSTLEKTRIVGVNSGSRSTAFFTGSTGSFHHGFRSRVVGISTKVEGGMVSAWFVSKDGFFRSFNRPVVNTVIVCRLPFMVGAVNLDTTGGHPVRSIGRTKQTNNLLIGDNVRWKTKLGVQDAPKTSHLHRGCE
jgi:hypothetical protein